MNLRTRLTLTNRPGETLRRRQDGELARLTVRWLVRSGMAWDDLIEFVRAGVLRWDSAKETDGIPAGVHVVNEERLLLWDAERKLGARRPAVDDLKPAPEVLGRQRRLGLTGAANRRALRRRVTPTRRPGRRPRKGPH